MNIGDITKLAGSHRRPKRVGRGKGSGSGKTSGRGHKGQGQRAGMTRHSLKEGGQMPTFRRIPKRGFTNAQFKVRYSIVNVASLDERFESGTHITSQSLLESGLIRNLHLPVKVLGNGEIGKKLKVDAAKFSKTAERKIIEAGGQAMLVK